MSKGTDVFDAQIGNRMIILLSNFCTVYASQEFDLTY